MMPVLWECVVGMVPITVLTIATLGAIIAGLTTSTEAAAMGAFGAILMVIATALHLEGPDVGLPEHADQHQHGAVSRSDLERLRRGVRPLRHRDLDHQRAARVPLPAWGTMALVLG
jgi:hypothetical protein